MAGCNDRSSRSGDGTVTPVDVPRTDGEILSEAASIDVPSLPSPVIVTDDHHESAISHVASLRETVSDRLDDVETIDDERVVPPNRALDRAADSIQNARSAGPSLEALSALRNAARELGQAQGVLRLIADEVDVGAVRAAIEEERAAVDSLRGDVDYRIAEPVAEYLPTATEAERTLDRQADLRDAALELEHAIDEERPDEARIASIVGRLERHRRLRDDAERFLETARDPQAPSLRDPIDDELERVETELDAIAEATPDRASDRREAGSVVERLEITRAEVGTRVARFRQQLPEYREDGRRLQGLLTGHERVLEFESVDDAVERTLPLLGAGEFPTERIVAEKRNAVAALADAVEATPLQRRLIEQSRYLLSSAERYHREDDPDPRGLAMTHVLYVGALVWTERGLDRGAAVSDSLAAHRSE
jgi:hypothetical protein